MPNELMTTQVVKEVASALGTMLAAYREHRMVRMEHKILLQQK